MFLVRKVIFHLFPLFENLEISDGIIVLIIGGIATAGYILVRTYIKSYISAIINEELEKTLNG